MTKLKFILFVCFLLCIQFLFAQAPVQPEFKPSGNWCGHSAAQEELFKKHPELLQQFEQMNKFLSEQVRSGSNGRMATPSGIITIPIVVHMINSGQAVGTPNNLTDQQVKDAFNYMDAHFNRRTNISRHTLNSDSTGIHFCLAKKGPANPDGTGPIIDYPNGAVLRYNGSLSSTWSKAGASAASYASEYALNGIKRITKGVPESALPLVGQWDLDKYYNVYFVTEIDNGESGTGGFAYYPDNSSTDRAIMITQYMTNQVYPLFAHEMGHALNLKHTFDGDGSSLGSSGSTQCPVNNNCNFDGDGICDTPPHKVDVACPAYSETTANPCVPGNNVAAILHNIMSYSQCPEVYSPGQTIRMRNTLDPSAPQTHRRQQVMPSNITACGCDGNNKPYAIIAADNTTPCIGASITLKDVSNYSPTSWKWRVISGGLYTINNSLTSKDLQISFSGSGPYTIRLLVSNGFGSDSTVAGRDIIIYPVTSQNLPLVERFNNNQPFPPANWKRTEVAGNTIWKKAANYAVAGSKDSCALLPDPEFGNRAAVSLTLKPLNLAGSTNPKLSYYRAYRNCFSNPADSLFIEASKDCGATFSTLKLYTYSNLGTATSNSGCGTAPNYTDYTDFVPVPASADWKKDSVFLSSFTTSNQVLIRFRRTGSSNGSIGFLYLDDINVSEAACTYVFNTGGQTFTASGGNDVATLNASPACAWTATSSCGFVTINNNSGTGNGNISYTVAANTGPARSCTINAMGRTFLISQDAAPVAACTYTINPGSQNFSAASATSSFAISAGANCTWTASTSCNFVTLNTNSGTGNGTINYTVATNSGAARTCNIYVGGKAFILTQDAAPVAACTYTINPGSQNFSSASAASSFAISAGANCTWTASTSCNFVSLNNNSGTGNGTINYTVATNSGASRTCNIYVGGKAFIITQDAAPVAACTYTINPGSQNFSSASATSSFAISAGANCTWTASTSCNFVSLNNNSGTGNGNINYTVAANSGPARTCNIYVGGKAFIITQDAAPVAACTYTINPGSQNFSAASAASSFAISAGANCTWTASTSCNFVTLNNNSGTGNGTINYTVATNTGPARTCNIYVGGKAFILTQDAAPVAACTYTINPGSQNFSSASAASSFAISAGANCTWTASTSCNFASLNNNSGTGNGTINYTVSTNTGAARTCNIYVGGKAFILTQDAAPVAACTYAINPASQNFSSASAASSFAISAGANCTWTASTSCNFVLLNNSNGTGNGAISYTVSANTGPARTCNIYVGGKTYIITQDAATVTTCTYTLSSYSMNFSSAGGNSNVSVLPKPVSSSCTWTAVAGCGFVNIQNPNGAGPGTVQFSVAPNNGPARFCNVTIAGQEFTIFQEAACNFSVSPASNNVDAAASTGMFTVNTGSGCTWTAQQSCSWLSLNQVQGNGVANVSYTVSANSGPARTCIITVNGEKHTVSQDAAPAAACSYTISPIPNPAGTGGTGTFTISTSLPSCTWALSYNCNFISFSPSAGAGSTTITYTAQANMTGNERSCNINIAGQNFNISQKAHIVCSYSISPSNAVIAKEGGTGSFNLSTASTCTWTASASCSFVNITNPAGSGNASVSYTVEPNIGTARTCTLTINGEVFEITQEGSGLSVANTILSGLTMYPNPATDMLNISLSKIPLLQTKLIFYNAWGQVVYQTVLKEKDTTLSIANLAKGYYTLRFSNLTETLIKKLVID